MWLEILPKVRDGAVVFLILQTMVLYAVPLLILYAITRGMRQLLSKVREGFIIVHDAVGKAFALVQRVVEGVRAPFLWIHGSIAGGQALISALRRIFLDGGRSNER